MKNIEINVKNFLNENKNYFINYNKMKSITTSGLEETHLISDDLGYMDLRIKNKDKITYKE